MLRFARIALVAWSLPALLLGCDESYCQGGVYEATKVHNDRCRNATVRIEMVDGRPFAVCTCPVTLPDAGTRPVETP